MIIKDDNIFDLLSNVSKKTIKTEYELASYVKSNYPELNLRKTTEHIKVKYITITGSEKSIILNKYGHRFIKIYRTKKFLQKNQIPIFIILGLTAIVIALLSYLK